MLNKNISYNLALNRPVKPQNHEEFGYWLAGLIDVFTPLCIYTSISEAVNRPRFKGSEAKGKPAPLQRKRGQMDISIKKMVA
jgi:hypothetical protein